MKNWYFSDTQPNNDKCATCNIIINDTTPQFLGKTGWKYFTTVKADLPKIQCGKSMPI
jgi:hypothetical protein